MHGTPHADDFVLEPVVGSTDADDFVLEPNDGFDDADDFDLVSNVGIAQPDGPKAILNHCQGIPPECVEGHPKRPYATLTSTVEASAIASSAASVRSKAWPGRPCTASECSPRWMRAVGPRMKRTGMA